jgi:hypothetical protein
MTTIAPSLNATDMEAFARLGIPLELLLEAGISRVTDTQAREYFTGHHHGDLAGVLFPYRDPASGHQATCRLRRDHPEIDGAGKPAHKYLMPYGDSPHLFFSPGAGVTLTNTNIPAVLVEGEKSALTLTALSRRAEWPMLAIALGGCHGWRTSRAGKAVDASGARVNIAGPQPDLSRVTWQDRNTIILFDSNAATNIMVRQARRQLAAELTSRGARVRIGTVPAEPEVNGPDDYRAAHDDAALLALIDDAVPVQPATVDELLEDCGVLGLTNPVDASALEPVVRAVQEALRGADALRVSAVRSKLVSLLKARGLRDAGRLVDSAIGVTAAPTTTDVPFLADVEPWPDPVDGAAVLNETATLLSKYVMLPTHAADAIALWCLHAFLMVVWTISPILSIVSPLKRCGKSTLMELIQVLVPRGLLVSNLSTASLFRAVEAFMPTLLSDEADTWLSDETSELKGIFNSGWRRGTARVLRCEGDEHEPTVFSTWAAKALSLIGKIPGTIEDRSIIISLRRKTANESIARFRHDQVEAEALPLRRQLQRWATDHEAVVLYSDPNDLEALNDRASDNWRPLRTLALALGDDWPARADAAALVFSGATTEADDNLNVQLLADLKVIFDNRDQDVLPSSVLVASLSEMPDRPWAEWSRGKPLNAHKLARLLSPFRIVPIDTRVDGKVLKSYRRGAFADAWERYLPSSPPDPGFKAQHRNNPNESGPKLPLSEAQHPEPVAVPKSENPSMNPGLCCGVAVSNPKNGPRSVLRLLLADEDDDGRA